VPPIPNQRAGAVTQVLLVLRLPVQYSAYGVNSSALADTSGTSRQNRRGTLAQPLADCSEITPGPNW
jgi:hypothetical protein